MEKIKDEFDSTGVFPRQKVTHKERTQKWKEDCVDSVIKQCNSFQSKRRSSFQNKRRNYDLFNNKINKADFNHVLNPFNLKGEKLNQYAMPASLQPYDVLSPIFFLLFGEERKRLFSPIVRAVNVDSVLWKEEQKKEILLNSLREYLIDEGASEQFLEQQLQKYSTYSVKDIKESQAQHMLTFLTKQQRVVETFQEGWKHGLLSSEEIYDAQDIAGAARLRAVNPLEINFILNNNSSIIDDAEKIYEKNRMNISDIIDEFYEDLTPDQIDDLECRRGGKDTIYNYDINDVPVWDYFPDASLLGDNIKMVNSIDDLDTLADNTILVHRVRWKGKRKIGFFNYLDENGDPQIIKVDEFFKAPKGNPDEYVDWMWINEYWGGIRIGADMYLKIRPRKNQFRSIDNLSECKSGYIGTVYSALNSQGTSLMDRLVPWLYLYLIIWYRTELLIAANQGNLAVLDISLCPDGWEIEKWLYYGSAMKLLFVDSYSEKMKKNGGNMNTSNQNRKIDIAQGNEIQFYISTLQFIEQKIKDTSGITDQRLGAIQTSERVGNTERSVLQSSHITEEYFAVHNYTKVRALECLLKVAQDIVEERGDKAFLYMNSDMDAVSGIIEKREFTAADFQMFVSDSQKDNMILETFKQHLNEALQNDKMDYSNIADILGSENIADIKNALKKGEQERIQREQATQEQQLSVQQQIHDEQMALEYEKLDRQDINLQLDREASLIEAEMKALAFDEGPNTTDISALGDQALAQQELNLKHLQEKEKLEQRDREIESTNVLKEKELRMKKEIENKKLQAVREQNRNQIQLADKKAKLDEKMMNQKIKLETMKAKAAIKKAKQKPKSS